MRHVRAHCRHKVILNKRSEIFRNQYRQYMLICFRSKWHLQEDFIFTAKLVSFNFVRRVGRRHPQRDILEKHILSGVSSWRIASFIRALSELLRVSDFALNAAYAK